MRGNYFLKPATNWLPRRKGKGRGRCDAAAKIIHIDNGALIAQKLPAIYQRVLSADWVYATPRSAAAATPTAPVTALPLYPARFVDLPEAPSPHSSLPTTFSLHSSLSLPFRLFTRWRTWLEWMSATSSPLAALILLMYPVHTYSQIPRPPSPSLSFFPLTSHFLISCFA